MSVLIFAFRHIIRGENLKGSWFCIPFYNINHNHFFPILIRHGKDEVSCTGTCINELSVFRLFDIIFFKVIF